jgi:mono/diheme cytochrome c family protein
MIAFPIARRRAWTILLCLLCANTLDAALARAEEAEQKPTSPIKAVAPLFEQYCMDCHDAETAKGGITLPTALDDAALLKEVRLWREVLDQLREQSMPPPGKPQPKPEERDQLSKWLRESLIRVQPNFKDPGRVTIRRLNRPEYNNTIRDLLGVNTKPADSFPSDGSGGGGFDNNADTLYVPAVLLERYLRAADDVLAKADRNKIYVSRPGDGLPYGSAPQIVIRRFVTRAFRRPAREDEVARYVKLYQSAVDRGQEQDAALKLALKAILVSPQFLFRIEQDREGMTEPYAIGEYELASRLSYFLWSSMPDDELFRLAGEGKLSDPNVLEQQARRMLADPKSHAMADSFASQWLEVRLLQTVMQPASPDYTPKLRDAMIGEAVMFVDSVFRDRRSIMTLIDADYTFVNEDLAKLYGIPDVKGPELRRVSLAKTPNRGGVLGLAGVLTATSYPTRSSPVLRGRWILEDLLGAAPPPPPPNVDALKETPSRDENGKKRTLRQRLEKHRSKPECASCHARIDPLGFGLENFDSIGRWRDTDSDEPIDSAGTLVSGESFRGPAELKRVLVTTKRDQFVKNVAERLLSYSLGRGLEYYDEPAVNEILTNLAKADDKADALVVEIAKSYPFRFRRDDVMAETNRPAR